MTQFRTQGLASLTFGSELQDSGFQGFRVSGFQSYRVTELQSYRVPELQGYRVTGLQSYRVSGFQGFRVSGFYYIRILVKFSVSNPVTCVIKVRKIACKSLKGRGVNSGLRLVYAYFEKEEKIVFVELYHKSDQENEDRERIFNDFK